MSEPVRILIDDVRVFRDGRSALVARNSLSARDLLMHCEGRVIDELWLDHDLGGEDTIWPVIDLLVERARWRKPLAVHTIWVHCASCLHAHRMITTLRKAGYAVARHVHARTFVHWPVA